MNSKILTAALAVSITLFCFTGGFAQQSNTPAPAANKSVSDLLERAQKLSEAGRGQLAITLIQEAVRISPDSPAAHIALGNELAKAGRLSEAVAEFELARKINPRDDQPYMSVGLIMLQQKKYAVAESLFRDASLLNPREPLHQLMRGVALLRRASGAEFSKSANLSERDRVLGHAEEAFAKAFELSGGRLFEVYIYRAMIYEIKGARLEAASELEKFLLANPNSARAANVREAIRNLRTNTSP